MSRKLEQQPNVILSIPEAHDGIIYLNKGFYGRFLAGVLYSFENAVEKIRMAFYKNTRKPTIKYAHPPMKRESDATISFDGARRGK